MTMFRPVPDKARHGNCAACKSPLTATTGALALRVTGDHYCWRCAVAVLDAVIAAMRDPLWAGATRKALNRPGKIRRMPRR